MNQHKHGYLEVIAGPMWSGKTTAMIRKLNRHSVISELNEVVYLKHQIDERCESKTSDWKRHNLNISNQIVKISLPKLSSIPDNVYSAAKVIGIDEGQFFGDLYEFCKKACDVDKKIIYVSGLNGDFERKFIGQIHKLLPIADEFILLKSLCMKCKDGTPAVFSHRMAQEKCLLSPSKIQNKQISVGGCEQYEALCRHHYLIEE